VELPKAIGNDRIAFVGPLSHSGEMVTNELGGPFL
jgi:hypothetical protein